VADAVRGGAVHNPSSTRPECKPGRANRQRSLRLRPERLRSFTVGAPTAAGQGMHGEGRPFSFRVVVLILVLVLISTNCPDDDIGRSSQCVLFYNNFLVWTFQLGIFRTAQSFVFPSAERNEELHLQLKNRAQNQHFNCTNQILHLYKSISCIKQWIHVSIHDNNGSYATTIWRGKIRKFWGACPAEVNNAKSMELYRTVVLVLCKALALVQLLVAWLSG